MTVRSEKDGPVTTVVLSRPAARNAVDAATAEALADAFRSFDADPEARVAVLWGEGGHFCAGADLKAIAEGGGDANRVAAGGDAPMGPTRAKLTRSVRRVHDIVSLGLFSIPTGGFSLFLFSESGTVKLDANWRPHRTILALASWLEDSLPPPPPEGSIGYRIGRWLAKVMRRSS
jgi:hypothetical protein